MVAPDRRDHPFPHVSPDIRIQPRMLATRPPAADDAPKSVRVDAREEVMSRRMILALVAILLPFASTATPVAIPAAVPVEAPARP
ncbi:hypothetical protein, partial [Sphingomonas sp. CCH18-H6]|uniref:hypothetical protein n=1 Tax=Sphingomonas sp. CCH18-H6 TaxID=1768787 RepID=UPI001E3A257E